MRPGDLYFMVLPRDSDGRPYLKTITTEVTLPDGMFFKSSAYWVGGMGLGTRGALASCLVFTREVD